MRRFRRTATTPPRLGCETPASGPGLSTPLLAELEALCDHARNLPWLGSREQRPEEYQRLAGIVVARLVEGWAEQTGGHGTLQDLLALPLTCAAVRGARSTAPVKHPILSAGTALAESPARSNTRD